MVTFASFELPEPVLRALADMGFETPSPIQEAVLPLVLAGGDAVGQAQTGTGKTAAFGIPLVVAALDGRSGLVLVPTRELAQQVTAEIERIGAHAGVSPIALYGGAPFGPQARALGRGGGDQPKVIVATPGRLRDHIERGTLDASVFSLVVLDEADEMLKMGFAEEVEEILVAVGPERQTMLFSATMPDPIRRLAERHMTDAEHVRVEGANSSVAAENTEQFAVQVRHKEKTDVLLRILAVERPSATLVFRHTRETVDELVDELRARGIAAEGLHGGLAQPARDAVVARLRDGRAKAIVATNVAARGLDVDVISHVINYDAPRETDAYVHRIGRTGRAGRDGRSFLFVTPADRGKLRGIERAVGARLRWFPVPTDADVAGAAETHLAAWLDREAARAEGLDRYVALVEKAVAEGKPLHVLAAAALRAAAKAEGLEPPALDARRERAAPDASRAPSTAGKVALCINVGRDDGVRPGDIVGALTNGGGLVGAEVGRIDILPRMSVAEVPSDRLADVMSNLEDATIRNRAVALRVADHWEFRGPPARAGPAPEREAPVASAAPAARPRPAPHRAPREERRDERPRPSGRFASRVARRA